MAEDIATIEGVSEHIVREIRLRARLLGIPEEELVGQLLDEYFDRHRDELCAEIKRVASLDRSRKATRVLRDLLNPHGPATLARLYPST